MLFTALLSTIIRSGSLCVINSAGHQQMIGDGSPPEATVRLISKASEYTLAFNPALSIGEAYMNGRLVIEQGSLYDFLDVVARNSNITGRHPWLTFVQHLSNRLRQSNPVSRARRNVAHHYDLSIMVLIVGTALITIFWPLE